ncbi:hypothetical protein [Methylobacterium sp. Gmos1]
MDNVIRPDFQRAAKARTGEGKTSAASAPVQYVKTYGEVGAHAVSLVRTRSALRGDVYQVVIEAPGGQIGPVGVEPATEDGMFDADRVGMAVTRTLELLALRSGDFDVA